MSDYGDDYSDYGDDFFYVEDEYMPADDLAEHAVASPPPAAYGDDDGVPEWDRFDYFNDLEYASDGYDDATFQSHTAKDTKIGQKRRRATGKSHGWKRRKSMESADVEAELACLAHSPIVWRAQSDRGLKPRFLDDNAQPYALLKNWREELADTPRWARGSPPAKSPGAQSGKQGKAKAAFASEPPSPTSELLEEAALAECEEMDEEEDDMDISQEALMAALQRQLAAAGGPLSGMDPQQLLQFAMRMATDKEAGDDIAGEMAEAMLEGEEEDDDADTEENLLSWVAQQRNAGKDAAAAEPKSPDVAKNDKRPPTPPSSEANRSVRATNETSRSGEAKSKSGTAKGTRSVSSLKRKADDELEPGAESSTRTTKKQATRSFDAPTAASHARATKATRAKR